MKTSIPTDPGINVNKLVEERATSGVAEFGSKLRFRARAAGGDAEAGLALLDKLGAASKESN